MRRSRAYDVVVWNSPASCQRWLVQTWKFRQFADAQYGCNLFARWHHRLWFKRWRVWEDRV